MSAPTQNKKQSAEGATCRPLEKWDCIYYEVTCEAKNCATCPYQDGYLK